jgi:hypothetical protein
MPNMVARTINTRSVSTKIRLLLFSPKVHYRAHNSALLIPTLSQLHITHLNRNSLGSILILLGRALSQAVSRRSVTAEARVQSQASLCGVCGASGDTGTGLSPSTLVYSCQYRYTNAELIFI